MTVIAWITDTPGWAYENRAHQVAACLPQYEHRFICYPREGFLPLLGADIVVCPDPRILPFTNGRECIVLNLNAIKLFAL